MRLAGTIFSAIFALIAVPLFTIAACNIAAQAAFLNRSTYDNILEDDVIFEDMLTVALPVILTAPDADNTEFEGREESPILFRDIVRALNEKPEVWEAVTTLLVPPQWIQQTVTDFVDMIFAISEGNFDVIENTINVSDIRRRFTGEQVSEAARLIITEAPECTSQQLIELETFFRDRLGIMPICNPIDSEMQARSIRVLELWFNALAANFTVDESTVSDFFGISRDDARGFNLLVELSRQGFILTYLCPMAFLCLVVILTVRSLKGFGRQIGSVMIASGIAVLFMMFMLQVAVFGIVTSALNAETAAEQFLTRLVSELLRSAFSQSSSSMLIQAAIFIALGFVLLVVAGFSGRESENISSLILIMEDGQFISTATQKRIGKIEQDEGER